MLVLAKRAALLAALGALAGCPDASDPGQSTLARGRAVYGNVCIACHNGDPAKDAALGPAVAGATRQLLEAKVLRGEYPPGYEPKRAGATMPNYEHLADAIDDLTAYLTQVGG